MGIGLGAGEELEGGAGGWEVDGTGEMGESGENGLEPGMGEDVVVVA